MKGNNRQIADDPRAATQQASVRERSSAPQRLRFRPLRSILSEAPERPDWIVEGQVATGVITLVGGAPKVGKTSLELAKLAAANRGECFAELRTRPAKVLLLSEERAQSLQQRIRQFAFPVEAAHALLFHEVRDTAWPAVVEQAVELCHKHSIEVLMVDTWGRWAGLRGDDENQAGAVYEAIHPIQQAAGEGLAVVLVHHQRKSGGDYGAGLRGSNALTASVDIILEVDRFHGVRRRLLRTLSRLDGGERELVVELDEHDHYQACGDRSAASRQAREQEVIDFLVQDGAGVIEDIAEKLDMSKPTAHRILQRLLAAGKVTRSGEGRRGDPHLYKARSRQ